MEEKKAKHRQMMKFCHSHLTHTIFNYCMRCFFFGIVYILSYKAMARILILDCMHKTR